MHADEDALGRIQSALNQRTRTLREVRAAAVTKGARVRIDNIKPKYLTDLTGTVTAIKQNRTRAIATVELDPDSTDLLRERTYVPAGVERHLLPGIPATCCHPV
ncbi:hypothetical protein [Streptomyces sp. NPDC001889]